jgi:ATP-dependent DNA helicase RecG
MKESFFYFNREVNIRYNRDGDTMDVKLDQVKGIGPQTLRILRNQGIWSTYDLVSHVPKGYEDFSITDLHDAKHKDVLTVLGTITTDLKIIRGGKVERLSFKAMILNQIVDIIAFGRSYLLKQLKKGDEVQIKGTYHLYYNQINASSIVKAEKRLAIKPVYRMEGLHDKTIMNLVSFIKEENLVSIYENIPKIFIDRYHLLQRKDALFELHLPESMTSIQQAKRRMKYEEAFYMQLKLIGNQKRGEKRRPKAYDIEAVKNLIDQLPYELTIDQKNAVNDIYRDFKKTESSYRLIQGDVGSGKTIVALLAAYAIVTSKEQVAIMAPTELLAFQHFQFFSNHLKDVKIALLTSKTKNKEEMKKAILAHEYDIVIGTHAVIESDVLFHHLGLIIIDEQHKFGVQTREELIKKAHSKDILYLTATPIPRTLALIAFGENHVSIIKEKPKQRIPIETRYITRDLVQEAYDKMHSALLRKEHCMVIVPAIDSEIIKDNIEHMTMELEQEFNVPIYTLHGKKTNTEQEEAMQSYLLNPGSILLATTMVEVGIDIPTATIITIFHAERFGLSQLHQLRGRVGRSNLASYCYLISEKEDIERLQILSKTTDGFKLSEYDLKMRGPGDFIGVEQSGYLDFKFINLIDDLKILQEAQKNVVELLNEPDFYTNPGYKYLVKAITPVPHV